MKPWYNSLSDDYNKLYFENIQKFQMTFQKENKVDEYFIDFYPSFSIKPGEKVEFIVYGQAVNGW